MPIPSPQYWKENLDYHRVEVTNCSTAAVKSEWIMPASEHTHSLLYLTCLCANSEPIVLCYARKKRIEKDLFLFFNVKHVFS